MYPLNITEFVKSSPPQKLGAFTSFINNPIRYKKSTELFSKLASEFLSIKFPDTLTQREKLFWIKNDIFVSPRCVCVKGDLKWREILSEYIKFCSASCAATHSNENLRIEVNIDEIKRMYEVEQRSIVEISEIIGNISNVALKNKMVDAGIKIRSHSENQKIHHHTGSYVKAGNTSLTEGYLTEQKLEKVLEFVFPGVEIIRQFKVFVSNRNLRVDYKLNISGHPVFVEFDGAAHYMAAERVHRDMMLVEYCKTNNIELVRIPYFIQISNKNFNFMFSDFVSNRYENWKGLESNYPNGFIDKKATLPVDFNKYGYSLFLKQVDGAGTVTAHEIWDSLFITSIVDGDIKKEIYQWRVSDELPPSTTFASWMQKLHDL